MRRYALTLLAAAAVGVAVSQSATAADLGRPVYKAPPPPPPPVSDWSGIYVGLEGGYGWGTQDGNPNFPGHVEPDTCTILGGTDCTALLPVINPLFDVVSALEGSQDPAVQLGNIKQNGWLFGGHFGAQKQWGSWVLGLEGDVDAADIKGSVQGSNSTFTSAGAIDGLTILPITRDQSVSLESKVDMLASLRGKVGWSFAPDWLLYGTGGAAFAHVKNTVDQSASVNNCVFTFAGTCFLVDLSGTDSLSGTSGDTMFGWAAGAGIDWKWQLDPGSALVFGVEYLHYGFPEQTITLADNSGGSFAFTAKEHVDSIKGRISYLFSIH